MLRTLFRSALLVALAAGALATAPAAAAAPAPTTGPPVPEAAPSNDAFANARTISGTSGSVTGTNVGATKEPNEPLHTGDDGGASVWYRWTAPSTGRVRFDTCTSAAVFTKVAVYTGSGVGNLAEVTPRRSLCAPGMKVSVAVTAGTTYRIAVDGMNLGSADQGPFTLTWSRAPGNDDFADARPIAGTSGSTSGNTTGASKESGEPDHAANVGGSSAWFTWTAPTTGITRFQTCRAGSFDTSLAVYTGDAVEALTPVLTEVGYTCFPQSALDLATTAGTTYRLAIDGFGTDAGTSEGPYTLTWGPRPAHGPDVRVRTGTDAWLGNDVYDANGRRQRQSVTVGRNGTARFSFLVQNDDTIARTFHVQGPGTSSSFRVTYRLADGYDATSIVVEGSDLPLLGGRSMRIDVVIKPRASVAVVGDTISVKLLATDVADLPMPADAAIAQVILR